MTDFTPGDLRDHEAVAAVIKNDADEVLMFLHKKYGFWTIPVGKAEPHETAYEGLCTEVREECGIMVTAATEISFRPYVYVRNGKDVKVNLHVYTVDAFTGTPQNLEEHKHPVMKFMPVEEIAKIDYLSDATMMFLSVLKQGASIEKSNL